MAASSSNEQDNARFVFGEAVLEEAIGGLKWKPPQEFTADDFRQWARQHVQTQLPRNRHHQLMASERRIRSAHQAELDQAEQLVAAAAQQCQAISEQLAALRETRRRLDKKLAGLRSFIAADGQRAPKKSSGAAAVVVALSEAALAQRRQEYEACTAESAALEQQAAELEAHGDYQQYAAARRQQDALLERLGLAGIESRLQSLSSAVGRQCNENGTNFEALAHRLWLHHCEALYGPPPPGHARQLLRNLTLSLPANEIDLMCVLVSVDEPAAPVRVEAIAECKSNPDDIARSFVRMTPLIAFFKNDGQRYSADAFRNKKYPRGLFTSAVHREPATRCSYTLTPASFDAFAVDEASGYFVDRVHMIARHRAEISRLPFKVEQIFASRLYRTLHIDENDIDAIPDRLLLTWKTEDWPDILPILQLYRDKHPDQFLFVQSS